MRSLWLPASDKNGWLRPVDIAASVSCLNLVDEKLRVLEIGIWRGSWSISILKNSLHTRITGVDPYPNLDRVRNEMISRMVENEVYNRFQLFESVDELLKLNMNFGLIHIDGEHSERQTYFDLVACSKLLSARGVIIVDDINVEWFPGVSSAMHKFMIEHEFRMFMTTQGKAYLSRKEFAGGLYSELLSSEFLAESADIFRHHPFSSYEQSTSVYDQEVLICRPKRIPTQE